MKWFKHYTNARHSKSLSEFERNAGFEGMGRYWRLLEFLGEHFDQSEIDVKFTFSRETLRELFRIRSWNKLQSFADQLTIVQGLTVTYSGNVYEINAPILLDLLSKDFKYSRKRIADNDAKIKSKNKIKSKSNTPNPFAEKIGTFLKLYNEHRGRLPKAISLSKKRAKVIESRIKENPDLEYWVEVIKRLAESDFCNGANDRAWVADFDFLTRPDTHLKALEGKYDNRQKLSANELMLAKLENEGGEGGFL